MKICFLAPANNYHTIKWCKWFISQGHEVHVLSFINAKIEKTTVHFVDSGTSAEADDSQKLKYLLKARQIKKIVSTIAPDIINVHYATSYGTVAALSGINDYVLSVWGADIYDFPQKSLLHKTMLKFSLNRAKYIFSTSNAMAIETSKYTKKKIEITPFGVDMELFNPNKRSRPFLLAEDGKFVIGTVKALTPKYGIDYLIKAVSLIRINHPEIPIFLRIAGKGEKAEEYKLLADKLGISDITTWLGYISQEDAAKEWANMDVAIIPSTLDSESFGVSAVEAQACGTPVIISNVAGLMEATCPDQTSIVINRKDEQQLADAILSLYFNHNYYNKLKNNCRAYVENKFSLSNCFGRIENLFTAIVENSKL